jgi:hypothetical protein
VKLSTKTIASLLLVTTVASVPGVGRARSADRRKESQFDRILQRHDRKGEIRADILGISPLEFRELHKKQSFEEIIKRHGFSSVRSFRLALLGKLRAELLQRGWTRQRIDNHLVVRSHRIN